MRSLWRDILCSFFMGMILPGIVLNVVVAVTRQFPSEMDVQITVPAETAAVTVSLPVMLLREDGSQIRLDMDPYLTGVLLAEIPASFEPEAMKAQAVAARTYARKAWETGGKHADGSVCTQPGCCQAYLTKEAFLSRGGTEADWEKIRDAVLSTSGECLKYDGELIEATYFSCSGGRTEDALEVWGSDYPYLQSVESPGEEDARWYTDSAYFTPEQFQEALGVHLSGQPGTWFAETIRTEGGGVKAIQIGETWYSGTQLRAMLDLRSTAFDVIPGENVIELVTKGYGHRVGMSQYGAEAMAVNGYSYDQILAHYYPGTVLVKLQEENASA